VADINHLAQTAAQQWYADTIYAYRLVEQQAARVGELHQEALATADKLRERMVAAQRALSAGQN
jgi:hypothetical protein